MFVDRRKILIGSLGSGSTIDIALGTNFFPVDNAELIEDKFVKDEIKKSINPIVDYKKVIFKPCDNNWKIIDKFKINLNFYTPSSILLNNPTHRGTGAQPGLYKDIGFIFDDLFCRTARFTNSFIRLSLYDNPYSGKNQLLSFSDIYTQVGKDQENQYGFVLPLDNCPITFTIGDPVLQPEEVHEGFHIYWFKDLVDNAPNQEYEMYAVVQFNNASNGKIYQMAASKDFNVNNITLTNLESENGITYLKVILKNDNGIYKYKFTPNTRQQLVPPGVNLNPSNSGIPTLTFWQTILKYIYKIVMEYIRKKINLEYYTVRNIPKSVLIKNSEGKTVIDETNPKYYYGKIPNYKIDSEGNFILTPLSQKIVNTIDVSVFITQDIDDMGIFTDEPFVPKSNTLSIKPNNFNSFTYGRLAGAPVSFYYTNNVTVSGYTDDS